MAYTGRELIAARCAKFFKDGDFVNLGIGVPTMCINYLPEGVDLWLETETGACGTGPTPPDRQMGYRLRRRRLQPHHPAAPGLLAPP